MDTPERFSLRSINPAAWLRRLLTPRDVMIIVPIEWLPNLGKLGQVILEDQPFPLGLTLPKYVIDKRLSPDGPDYPEGGSRHSSHDEGNPNGLVGARAASGNALRQDADLQRVVDPFADADAAEARRQGGAVRPAARDAGQHGRRRRRWPAQHLFGLRRPAHRLRP